MWWWKKSGKEMRMHMTALKDEMNDVKSIFDEIDDDGSGEINREEVQQLMTMLGVRMNADELDETMLELDKVPNHPPKTIFQNHRTRLRTVGFN
jgi:Ca2+-binding EF-hand superfamily protein